MQTDWQIDPARFGAVPYPYIPAAELLEIPIDTDTQRITFVGRLEIRKGMLDLMQAIPRVLKQYPAAKFRFVGPAWPSPQPHLDMQAYLCKNLSAYQHALEFTGAVPLDSIPQYLAETDICVFPSIWESFWACLSLAAAAVSLQ
ncbi:MAG: glycosyltransferase family 4 protein, partial [Alkalinema sp. RL_2_19]|nr:glycosyltransferase family 4 protein [Alkalinema sp. RL_2_19]